MALRIVTRREYHITAHTYEEQRRQINYVQAMAERAGVSPLALSISAGAGEAHMVMGYDEPAVEVDV